MPGQGLHIDDLSAHVGPQQDTREEELVVNIRARALARR